MLADLLILGAESLVFVAVFIILAYNIAEAYKPEEY